MMRGMISSSVRVWNSALVLVSVVALLPFTCDGQRYRNEKGRRSSNGSAGGRDGTCQPEFLARCIKMADSLLKEPKYVFPTNVEDIDQVCRVIFPQTWSGFISCVKSFTSTCVGSSQMSEFNRAVGDSINSVHKMCTNEDYRNNYLRNAGCIKEKATSVGSCKIYYDKLVSHIQASSSSSQDLCCAHNSFKTCILEEAKKCPCEQGWCHDQTQKASHFAKVIMDNNLGFLLKQCNSLVIPPSTCNGYVAKSPRYEDVPPAGKDTDLQGNYDGKYFPSGNRGPFFSNSGTNEPKQTETNGSRKPKQVPAPTSADFEFDVGRSHATNRDDDQEVSPVTDAKVQDPQSVETTPNFEKNTLNVVKNKLTTWLGDSEITDFDEFLRKTLSTGASTRDPRRPLLSGGPPSASSPLSQGASAILSLLVYKLLRIGT